MSMIKFDRKDMYIEYSESAARVVDELIKGIEACGFKKYRKTDGSHNFKLGSVIILGYEKDWYTALLTKKDLDRSIVNRSIINRHFEEVHYTMFLPKDNSEPHTVLTMKLLSSIKPSI